MGHEEDGAVARGMTSVQVRVSGVEPDGIAFGQIGGGPCRARGGADGFENFFQAVPPDDIVVDVRAVWDDAVAAQAWEGPPVWVHGDLHPANVVVSDGALSGITDFGDMFAGDPA
ncbi:phosphotransferase [Actinomadura citrea]|uniref:Aminoglycoside phosphotransferase domain-containing protein n=1 Tax=Actinomadura citrea TaxID=46158 RepID=A0A7Y9GAY1_9ACTN|nr:hypothetical protein [Actinomadura citrea]GGU04709.1 hypothetical protein GCM10010177_74990 [Actinomadura citrea]